MITVYSGTLGSGKSYHAVKSIFEYLRRGSDVIADFPVDVSGVRGLKGTFVYQPELTIKFLVDYATAHHDFSSSDESQTVVVIDEVYSYFDPRDFDRADRMLWVSFLKVSRHYCFSFLFICQNARTDLDKKILKTIEYDVVHKSVHRLQWGFQLLSLLTGKWFLCIRWSCSQGVQKIKVDVTWLHLNKKLARRYNSHHLFDNSAFLRQLEKYESKYGKGESDGCGGD